jgi:hypothetical protein
MDTCEGSLQVLVTVERGGKAIPRPVARPGVEADSTVADDPSRAPAKTLGRRENRVRRRKLERVGPAEDPALRCHAGADPTLVTRQERRDEPLSLLGGTAEPAEDFEGLDQSCLRPPAGAADQGFPFAWIR